MKRVILSLMVLLIISGCSRYNYTYEYGDPIYDEDYIPTEPIVTTDPSLYVITYRLETRPWQNPWGSMWYYDTPYFGYNYYNTMWGYNYNWCYSGWNPYMVNHNPYWNPYGHHWNSLYNNYWNYSTNYYWQNYWMHRPPPIWYAHRSNMGWFRTSRYFKNNRSTLNMGLNRIDRKVKVPDSDPPTRNTETIIRRDNSNHQRVPSKSPVRSVRPSNPNTPPRQYNVPQRQPNPKPTRYTRPRQYNVPQRQSRPQPTRPVRPSTPNRYNKPTRNYTPNRGTKPIIKKSIPRSNENTRKYKR